MLELATAFDAGLFVIKLIQIAASRIGFHIQLAKRRNDHLRNACEGAASRLLVAVAGAADEKADDGDPHGHSWNAETPAPSHVLLDVHQYRGCNERTDVDGEVEPVEEGALSLLLFHVVFVELVSSVKMKSFSTRISDTRMSKFNTNPRFYMVIR